MGADVELPNRGEIYRRQLAVLRVDERDRLHLFVECGPDVGILRTPDASHREVLLWARGVGDGGDSADLTNDALTRWARLGPAHSNAARRNVPVWWCGVGQASLVDRGVPAGL